MTGPALPWECSCGAWLRVKPYLFNWVDLLALFAFCLISLFLAYKYWWACNPFAFFLPIVVWLTLRISVEFAVEEVTAPDEESREIA
jgi:hypothetical protein